MSLPDILKLLLFIVHFGALAIAISAVVYITSVWLRGRFSASDYFPYQEIEVALKVLGLSLTAVWLSALPGILFAALAPNRYLSVPGVCLLTVFTAFSCVVGWITLRAQQSLTGTASRNLNRFVNSGLRIALAGTLSSSVVLATLLLPANILPAPVASLHPDNFAIEIMMAAGLIFLILLSALCVFRDEWVNLYRTDN